MGRVALVVICASLGAFSALASENANSISAPSSLRCTSKSAVCLPHGNASILPRRGMQMAGQCQDNCRIVFNHCRAIGLPRGDCADEYNTCMNAC